MGQSKVIVSGRTAAGVPTDLLVDADGTLHTAGGGGGSAVTVADGADVAEGATSDVAWVGSGNGTMVAISKAEYAKLEAIRALLAGSITVTGPLTDTQLRASAVPVSGPLTDTQLRASAVPISDGGGSLTVDALAGTPVFSRLSDGAVALIGQKVMASSLPVAMASDQPALAAPTLTKGTQGATGYSVQDLKDSGRVNIMWTAEFASASAADTLVTLTESRDGAATATFTSKVVTNGKRLRITSLSLSMESGGSTGTAIQRGILRLLFNTAGAVVAGTSPRQGTWGIGSPGAMVLKQTVGPYVFEFPDGIEFLGDGTKQIGFSLIAPDWVVTTMIPTWRLTVTAFEY